MPVKHYDQLAAVAVEDAPFNYDPDLAGDEAEQDSATVKPFTIWTPSQFLEWKPPADSCLLGDSLIDRGEFTSFLGIGGLGKSRLTLWLAICQITGREWCGLPVHGEPVIWLFLAPENGIRRWQADLGGMLGTLNEDERAKVEEFLRGYAMTLDEDGDLCLSNPSTCARLATTLSTVAPGAIVFDPFADMIDGDENKNQDMVSTLRALRAIVSKSAPNAASIIVHHSRTGASNVIQAGDNFNAGNFARGAKALYSRVRCEIQLAPADKDDPNRLLLSCGKASNGPKFAPRGILFDPETMSYSIDPDFDLDDWRNNVEGKRTATAVSIADLVATVAGTYKPGEDVTTKTVFEEFKAIGVTLRTVQRKLRDAVEAGYLKDGSKRGTWRLGSKPLKS
ncbi:MAG: AAA family ATPase [Candidatus Accumulibacter sp.]|nr:AAA family ATPase [Accumulibacter sp.]